VGEEVGKPVARVLLVLAAALKGVFWSVHVTSLSIGFMVDRNLFGDMTDPISGGAGWVGAGLLGLVLGWLLLIHLPQKDKQLVQLLETKDKQIAESIVNHDRIHARSLETFKTTIEVLQNTFDRRAQNNLEVFSETLKEERAVYLRWHEDNRDRLDNIMMNQKEQRHYLMNLAHQLGLQRAVEAKLQSEARSRNAPPEERTDP